MKKKAKVAVVLPVYNTEKYLKQCLKSLLAQSLKDIQIIIVNDGSTDNSLQIALDYAKEDNRIIIHNQKQSNAGVARNNGMSFANAEYIIFLDSDDFFNKDFLLKMYKKIKADDSDVVICNYNKFDENTKKFISFNGINHNLISNKDCIKTKEYYNNLFTIFTPVPWNKLIKLNLCKDMLFSKTKSCNDLFFIYSFLAKTNKISIINEVLLTYRINRKDSLVLNKDKNAFDFIYAYDELFNEVKDNSYLYESFLNSYISSCLWTLNRVFKNRAKLKSKIKEQLDYKYDVSNIASDNAKLLLNLINENIYVCLSSYPSRINTLIYSLKSILNQSLMPDKIYLNLAYDEFKNKEDDLPLDIIKLSKEAKIQINWCENLKSYKKYMQLFDKNNDVIVCADDDLLYPENWLYELYFAYINDKSVVHCHRAHIVLFNKTLLPYNLWIKSANIKNASTHLLATSGAGVLLKSDYFNEDFYNKELFSKLAPYADDIWLFFNLFLQDKKIKIVNNAYKNIVYVENTQENSLWQINKDNNDIQINNVLSYYKDLNKKLSSTISINNYIEEIKFHLSSVRVEVLSDDINIDDFFVFCNKASFNKVKNSFILIDNLDELNFYCKVNSQGVLKFRFRANIINNTSLQVIFKEIKINDKFYLNKAKLVSYDEYVVFNINVNANEIIKLSYRKENYNFKYKDNLKTALNKYFIAHSSLKNFHNYILKSLSAFYSHFNLKNFLVKILRLFVKIEREKYKTRYYILGIKIVRYKLRRELLDNIKLLQDELKRLSNKLDK